VKLLDLGYNIYRLSNVPPTVLGEEREVQGSFGESLPSTSVSETYIFVRSDAQV